jgi:ribonuclease HI
LIEMPDARTGQLVRRDYWLSEPGTTNNRMAIRSAIEALRLVDAGDARRALVFTSDSQYLVKGMREWVPGWIRRGWRRKEGEVLNLALWKELVAAARRHEVDWRWVRGHHGHAQNEYADALAVRAAQRQDASLRAVPSGFDAWLAAEHARGRTALRPDPLPGLARFRPAPPLPPDPAASLFL